LLGVCLQCSYSRAGGTPRLTLCCSATGRHFAACENARLSNGPRTMDIERINQIGNTLSDLTSRTEALRRYL